MKIFKKFDRTFLKKNKELPKNHNNIYMKNGNIDKIRFCSSQIRVASCYRRTIRKAPLGYSFSIFTNLQLAKKRI